MIEKKVQKQPAGKKKSLVLTYSFFFFFWAYLFIYLKENKAPTFIETSLLGGGIVWKHKSTIEINKLWAICLNYNYLLTTIYNKMMSKGIEDQRCSSKFVKEYSKPKEPYYDFSIAGIRPIAIHDIFLSAISQEQRRIRWSWPKAPKTCTLNYSAKARNDFTQITTAKPVQKSLRKLPN